MGRPGFTQGSMFEGLYERVLQLEGKTSSLVVSWK
jgi:hypothetical protein